MGAATSMGAGRGITTTISGLLILFPMAEPAMGPVAGTGAAEMPETSDNGLVVYADLLGIRPSNVPRETRLKHVCFFPAGKCGSELVGCVSWSSPRDVA